MDPQSRSTLHAEALRMMPGIGLRDYLLGVRRAIMAYPADTASTS
jgi:hypothetical protein